jgi:hypothetical protein
MEMKLNQNKTKRLYFQIQWWKKDQMRLLDLL